MQAVIRSVAMSTLSSAARGVAPNGTQTRGILRRKWIQFQLEITHNVTAVRPLKYTIRCNSCQYTKTFFVVLQKYRKVTEFQFLIYSKFEFQGNTFF